MIMKCSSNALTRNYSTCQRKPRHSMLSVVMLPLTSHSSAPTLLNNRLPCYPPSQKTMGVSPWMNATVGPSEARRAPSLRSRTGSFGGVSKEGTSVKSTEKRKDAIGVNPWRLHFLPWLLSSKGFSFCMSPWPSSVELFTPVDNPVSKFTIFSVVHPVPRTYARGFGALPFGEVRNIHPRTHVRSVLWFGVKLLA